MPSSGGFSGGLKALDLSLSTNVTQNHIKLQKADKNGAALTKGWGRGRREPGGPNAHATA